MSWGFRYRPYVPVAKRKANGKAYALKLAKKENRTLAPVELAGRTIASSFWGKAWCENLEQYSDFENRLPRGRTYVRNGSIIDLQIQRGKITAIVSGSEVYRVTIDIKTVPTAVWAQIKKDCSRSVNSLIDLLQGRFDQGIMERLSQCDGGLFPRPAEIKLACTCPDWAGMCKHVAATLYGVGARLDSQPELLFVLRDVDHLELINEAVEAENLDQAFASETGAALGSAELGEIFGIEIEGAVQEDSPPTKSKVKAARPRSKPKPGAAARQQSKPTKAAGASRSKRKSASL